MSKRIFAQPSFRRLFAAQTISRWGDTFNAVAIVILVFRITGSGLRVAATVAFEILPILLLAPVAGVVADRFQKRRVMIGADLFRALIVLVAGPHRLLWSTPLRPDWRPDLSSSTPPRAHSSRPWWTPMILSTPTPPCGPQP